VLHECTNLIRTDLGNGDGTFQPRIDTPNTIPGALPASGFRAADIDADGRLDLIILQGDITFMGGNGDGTFRSPRSISASDQTPRDSQSLRIRRRRLQQ